METKWFDTVIPGHYTPEEFARLKKQAEATWKAAFEAGKLAEREGVFKWLEEYKCEGCSTPGFITFVIPIKDWQTLNKKPTSEVKE